MRIDTQNNDIIQSLSEDLSIINSRIVARLLNSIRDVYGSIHCLECERKKIHKILTNACSMIVLVQEVFCWLENPK